MPNESFDAFMAQRQRPVIGGDPLESLPDFGSFMEAKRTSSGGPALPAPSPGIDLPHPDEVEAATARHAQTMARLVTQQLNPQMILPEQEPPPPPMMVAPGGVMRRIKGTEAYRNPGGASLIVPGSAPLGERMAGGGPTFSGPASPAVMPIRKLVREVAATPIVTDEDIDKSFPFLVGPFRLHAGVLKSVAAMTSPENAAITAATGGAGAVRGTTAGLLRAGLSAYFATQAGRQLMEKYQPIKESVEAGDWQRTMELGGGALADAAIIYGAAKHSGSELKNLPNEFIQARARKYAKQIEKVRADSERDAAQPPANSTGTETYRPADAQTNSPSTDAMLSPSSPGLEDSFGTFMKARLAQQENTDAQQPEKTAPAREPTPELETRPVGLSEPGGGPASEANTAASSEATVAAPPRTFTGTVETEPAPKKPLHEMSPAELDDVIRYQSASDKEVLHEIFGPDEAKRYARLERTADSVNDPDRADEAYKELARMQDSLSERQRNRLFGIDGPDDYSLEDAHGMRNALRKIDPTSPQSLGESLKWAVTKFDPENPTADPERYAQMRHAASIARENGWDTGEIMAHAYKSAAERFDSPENAAFILDRFRRPGAAIQTEQLAPAADSLDANSTLPAQADGTATPSGESLKPTIGRTTGIPENREAGRMTAPPTGNGPSLAGESERGAIDTELLTLGAGKFIEHDVAPAVRDVASGIRDTADDILKVLAPTLRSPQSKTASLIMRGRLSELARKSDRAQSALQDASRFFAKQPADENFGFIDRMESGSPQKNADLDQIAGTLRLLLDSKRADVQALGKGKLQSFYENYFPHIWKRPESARDVFSSFFGKRPLEGGKSFLKQRTLPTIADGRAAGLEPITDNPVEMALLKAREMDRYVMAHRTLADWESSGLARMLVPGQKAPPGWMRITDPIGAVYGKSANGGMVMHGNWYAPEGAARIMNNYLSPGLRDIAAYRMAMGLNNVLNQFQLGLSAFHLGFTAADTTVSKAALGFQALMRGRPIKAARFFAETPTAAFTTFLKGDKMLKEWYRPGSQGAAIGNLVDGLEAAGGRARMDQMYRTHIADKMREALRHGNIIGAAIRAPFAGVEWTSNLIMNEVVPRMKLGAFADMARFHLEQLGPDATFEDARRVLTQDWNSVENRLGEMTYDNLFWNKIAKDLAMLTTRSVGWTLGTLREIGGGVADTVVQPVNALQGKPVNLNRLSYILGLVTVNAAMSSIYQYLKTGKAPDDLKDYFFPKNGELDEQGHPQRVSWPTYVKDIYHYGTHPWKTVEGKIAPIWSAFGQMIHNEDFFGTEIRNTDDPLVQQLREEAQFAVGQFEPLALRNFEREGKLDASPATRAEQFVGVTPAPPDINQSPAERMAHEMAAAHVPDEPRTKEQEDRRELRQSLTRSLRRGKGVPKEVIAARVNGQLSKRDTEEAFRAARETPLQQAFTRLGLEEAAKVYSAADRAERKQLQPILMRKARTALSSLPPAQKAKALASVRGALSSPSR